MKLGIHDGVPADLYHADKSALSASGMKLLLPPSTPAHFKWYQDHPQPTSDTLDFGTVAHRLVLEGGDAAIVTPDDVAEATEEAGEDFEVEAFIRDFTRGDTILSVAYDSWRTNEAKGIRAAATKLGKVALLEKDFLTARAMADKLREHPIASALLSEGKAEQSAWFKDPVTGVTIRSRFDWLPDANARARFILSDYKTAASAAVRDFASAAARYRYHLQQAVYRLAVRELLGIPDPGFLFIVQEKEAPYAVNVVELDPDAARMGEELARRAINLYAHCLEHDTWPGYEGIALATFPTYATYEHQEILDAA